MGKIDKLKEGDLVVRRGNKKPYIVLAITKYERKVYGAGPSGSDRKNFLLLSTNGRQMWQVDTALKVEYYLPGDPWFDDIR
jgi:hypothetical protein